MKANKEKSIPDEVEKAWNAYVTVLEQHIGLLPGPEDASLLRQACNEFWSAYRKYRYY